MKRLSLIAMGLLLSAPLQGAPLRFSLTTTPDKGIELDGPRVADARTLAGYVLTKEKVLRYNPVGDGSYQGVRAVLFTPQWLYTISIENHNEQEPNPQLDTLTIEMRRKDKSKDDIIQLKDIGLDGHCNQAMISEQFSGTIQSNITYPAGDAAKAAEYEATVQRLYHGALDTLLWFYEKR